MNERHSALSTTPHSKWHSVIIGELQVQLRYVITVLTIVPVQPRTHIMASIYAKPSNRSVEAPTTNL